MAFPSADAIPAAWLQSGLISAWHWLEANGLTVLIAIYFVAVACIVFLSLYVNRLSRCLRHLRQEVENDSKRIDELAKSVAEQASTTAVPPPLATPGTTDVPAGKPELGPAEVRSELESVLSELWDDSEAARRER